MFFVRMNPSDFHATNACVRKCGHLEESTDVEGISDIMAIHNWQPAKC